MLSLLLSRPHDALSTPVRTFLSHHCCIPPPLLALVLYFAIHAVLFFLLYVIQLGVYRACEICRRPAAVCNASLYSAFNPPPFAASYLLRSIALSTENVHEPLVEAPAFRTFASLANEAFSSPTFSVLLQLKKLRQAIARKPAGLPASVSVVALQVLSDFPTLRRMIYNEGNEDSFEFVIAVVYRTVESHKKRKDLERRLAEELAEGVGYCLKGKVGRVLNSLRGYGVIEGELDLANELDIANFHTAFVERVISPAISLTSKKAKEKASNEVLDEFGIFDLKLRKEWVEQALEG